MADVHNEGGGHGKESTASVVKNFYIPSCRVSFVINLALYAQYICNLNIFCFFFLLKEFHLKVEI